MSEKRIYSNPKQLQIITSTKKRKVFIGGRGSGKSTVDGDESYQCIFTMPRSRGFIASATESTVLNQSLPSIIERWEMYGLVENEHFTVQKKPKSWFDRPYNPPKNHSKAIYFVNGAVMDILSTYSKNPGRGGNYQWGIIDEAGICNYERITKSIYPAIRGNIYRVAKIKVHAGYKPPFGYVSQEGNEFYWNAPFRDNPRYGMVIFTSTVPWSIEGQWLLDMESDIDVEFVESTWRDNTEVLGHDYGPRMQDILPESLYRVEVENERPGKLPNSFYPEYDESKHVTSRNGYRHDEPIEISFDFNATFNSMIVCQPRDHEAYIHDALFVKGNQTVEDLVDLFCRKYANHGIKEVTIYGDRNGNNRYANSIYTIYDRIKDRLERAGWTYFHPSKGLDAPHKEKHELLNIAFKESSGEQMPPIRIYKYNCGPLVQSIMLAPITRDFKKDKSSERRLKDTDHREMATDLSDAFDNWYYFRYQHFYRPSSYSSGAGFAIG